MKPNLLLLHGALGSQKQFDPIKNLLNEHFEVYSMDFEGHGEYVSDKAFSIELFSENVIDFLAKEKITDVNIFGYSMGGYVALQTALEHPEKINKIVTLGTKFDWTPESAAKETKMLNPDVIEAKVPHFAQKLQDEHAPQDWKVIMRRTADMMMKLGNGAALKEEDFKSIAHEVTIGIGTEDNMVSLAESARVAQALPKATLKKLDGIKHPIEKVDAGILGEHIKYSIS